EVTFEINTDGIVNVSAADMETGQKTSTTISLSSGLSESDIQRSILQNRQTRLARGMVHAVNPGTSRDVLPELPSALEARATAARDPPDTRGSAAPLPPGEPPRATTTQPLAPVDPSEVPDAGFETTGSFRAGSGTPILDAPFPPAPQAPRASTPTGSPPP